MKLLQFLTQVILDLVDKIENVENESWRKEMRQRAAAKSEM